MNSAPADILNILDNQRQGIIQVPSLIHPLYQISNLFQRSIYIKRDDLLPHAQGGNKLRKLDFFMHSILQNGYDTVITAGAAQSNHCRQTAAVCSMFGIECHLLLGGENSNSGNLLLDKMLGAQLHFTGDNRKGEDIPYLKAGLEEKGKKVFVIPYGGSSVEGVLGFLWAMHELSTQLTDIDYLFFASSSGATQAGICLGNELFFNGKIKPVGIQVDKAQQNEFEVKIENLLNQTQEFLHLPSSKMNIEIDKSCNRGGYGNTSSKEVERMLNLFQKESVLLDPVYTVRAYNGMMKWLEEEKVPADSNVVFWHTGGVPVSYSESFLPALKKHHIL